MPRRRRSHSHRRRRRSALSRRLPALLLTLSVGIAALIFTRIGPRQETHPADGVDAATTDMDGVDDGPPADSVEAADAAGRRVYRYSVIPGGAYDSDELEAAVDRDPVVAAAYRDAAAAGVRAEVLPSDRLAYVSYRMGDRIYWTRHRVQLRRGETILANDSVQLRGRCGNQISDEPMLPVADREPDPSELDALVVPPSGGLNARPLMLAYLGLDAPLGVGPDGALGATARSSLAPAGWIAAPPAGADVDEGLLPIDAGSPLNPPPDFTFTPPPSPPSGSIIFDVVPNPNGASEPPTVTVRVPGGLEPPTQAAVPDCADDPGCGGLFPGGPESPPNGPAAPVPTPEPGTFFLIGGGIAGIVARKLRSRG